MNLMQLMTLKPFPITQPSKIYVDGELFQETFKVEESTKTCVRCDEEKPFTAFYTSKFSGLVCRECANAIARARYAKNKEKLLS